MAINKRFASEEYVNENYAPISHPHSWADSGDKITYGDTLTWDGNTEGRNTFNNFYFVSGAVPTEADFSNGGTLTVFSAGNLESVEIGGSLGLVVWADVSEQFGTEAHALVVTTNGNMLVGVLPNGAELNGVVYEKGVYFQKPDDITYTTSLTINGFNGFETTETVPLPNKYLPEHLQFGRNTTTLVDNQTFTLDEGMTMLEGVTIEESGVYAVVYNGVEYTDLQAVPMAVEDGITAYFVGNSALAGGEDNGMPFAVATVPQQGTVLVDVASSTTCTVTIISSGIKCLDNKYLAPFETVEIGVDTLEWDGNKDGIENVNDTLYHISNAVPTLEELHNGGNFVVDGSTTVEYTSFAEAVSGVLADPDMYVLVVLTEGVTMGDFVFPKTGIYFTSGITSFTINGYTGFTEEQVKLKEEYLPETINSIVFYVDDGRNTVTTDITYDKLLEIWVAGKVNLTNIIEIRINDYNEFGSRYYCKDITYTDNRQFIVTVDAPSVYGTIVLDETGIMFDAEA